MLGIIWGLNQQTAENRLQKLINDYAMRDIAIDLRQTRITKFNGSTIVFQNGDVWRSLSARLSRRGVKSNIALIDNRISKAFVDEVIMPCNCTKPYNAYNYFEGEAYEEKEVEMSEEEIAFLKETFNTEVDESLLWVLPAPSGQKPLII